MKRMLAAVPSSMRRILPSLTFCLLLTTRLQAQQPGNNGVRLSFVRAENAARCIAAPALQGEIVRRMGYDPFDGAARQWIEGFIQRQSDYFELQLFERDAAGNTMGSRLLREQAGDCHKLDEAIVLAIALIIDPMAQLAQPTSRASHTTATEPAVLNVPVAAAGVPETPQPLSRASSPAALRRDSSALAANAPLRKSAAPTQQENVRKLGAAFVSADAAVLGGVLPGAAFGAELMTRFSVDTRERIALRFSGLLMPEKRQNTGTGDLGYSLATLEVGACLSTEPRRTNPLVGFGCVGFGLGAVHTVVHAPEPLKPHDRLWAAFRFELGANLRIFGPVWLGVRAFDLLAPRRWDFNVMVNRQRTRVFSQKALMPGAALGIGLHFD